MDLCEVQLSTNPCYKALKHRKDRFPDVCEVQVEVGRLARPVFESFPGKKTKFQLAIFLFLSLMLALMRFSVIMSRLSMSFWA